MPRPVETQVHDKFKVFIPEADLPYDEAVRRVSNAVAAWSAERKYAPKSLGVELLDFGRHPHPSGKSSSFVFSIGYRDATEDEPGYPVSIKAVSLGHPRFFPDDIEKAMARAAADVPRVICHEFFVTHEVAEFVMVFLVHG